MSTIVERFCAPPESSAASPEAALRWRSGTLRDYAVLAPFHYLRNKPVTATRVIVIESLAPSTLNRWRSIQDSIFVENRVLLNNILHAKTREKRDDTSTVGGWGKGLIVGVLVESLPALSCALRDAATGGRYAEWKDRRMAARLLNSEVRCLSRVVVHPQWRGLGLAVKLVRRALETMTTPYTEALAAMGRVHPFFRLAGMKEYRRPPLPGRQRLIDAMRYCGVEPWELASEQRMAAALEGAGNFLRRELARWAGRRLTLEEQLCKAREELLCEPVYYGFRREDGEHE